jgi:hypothetical protein
MALAGTAGDASQGKPGDALSSAAGLARRPAGLSLSENPRPRTRSADPWWAARLGQSRIPNIGGSCSHPGSGRRKAPAPRKTCAICAQAHKTGSSMPPAEK